MSSNRELAERLIRVAPQVFRPRFDLLGEDRRLLLGDGANRVGWYYNEPDTFPGNGDFIAWCKAEIGKRGYWWSVDNWPAGDGDVTVVISKAKLDEHSGHSESTEAAALVACLIEALEAEHSPLDGPIPPVDIQNNAALEQKEN